MPEVRHASSLAQVHNVVEGDEIVILNLIPLTLYSKTRTYWKDY